MAVSNLVITFQWENGNAFKMSSNLDGAGSVTICQVDENGEFAHIWEYAKSICSTYIGRYLDNIGNDMKA